MRFIGRDPKRIIYPALVLALAVTWVQAQGTAPDLSIIKSHVGNFLVGQQGEYIIVVRNVGTGSTAGQVSVSDQLPAGMTAASISGDGWSCSQPSGPCLRADPIAARESYPAIHLTVNVTAPGQVVNTATVSGGGDNNPGNNVSEDATLILSGVSDLRVIKTHLGNFTPGQNGATYTITVDNVGTGATSSAVTVADSLPAGLTAVSINGQGWTCTQPAGPCSRTDSLPPGSSYGPLTLTVNVAANAQGTLTNVATVSTAGDTNSNNDTSNDATIISPAGADLRIRKTHQGDFTQGQTGTYTIQVDNVGQLASSGTVTVTDTPPQGITITGISGNGWGCSPLAGPCTRSDALAPGASYPPITVTVSVAPNAPASLINVATVSGGSDTNNTNNTVSDPTNVINPSGCTIESAHPYADNFDFTWTCVVPGNPTSSNVAFDALTFLEAGDLLYITDANGNNIQGSPFTGGSLAGQNKIVTGNTVKLRLVTNVFGTAYGFKAIITPSSTPPPVTGTDLTITKTHTGNFFQGQVGAQYTITVKNSGTSATSGVVTVADVAPAGLTITGISGNGWTCTQPAGPCTRSDVLAPNGTYPVLTVTANVAANAPAALANTATVSGGSDTNTNNNSSSDSTTIVVPKAVCTGPNGPLLPEGTLPESTHPYDNDLVQTFTCVQQGSPSGIAVTFDSLTFLDGGDTVAILDKNGNPVAGSPFSGESLMNATINVPGDTVKLVLTTDSRRNAYGFKVTSITSLITSSPDLTVTKTHSGNFAQGQNGATYTIIVRNIGGVASTGTITLTDVLPNGLVATGISGQGWNCTAPAGPCTRTDALAAGASAPPITLTVNVAANAPASVTNTATVSGGGDTNSANNNAGDPTTITPVTQPVCEPLESPHPYPTNFDKTYTCTLTGNVASVNLTFDAQTSLAPDADMIFITNGAGVNIAGSPFTGQSLAGQTVNVPGNTVKIRLVTDDRRVDYGFLVTNIVGVP